MSDQPPPPRDRPSQKRRTVQLSMSRSLTLGFTLLVLASLGLTLWITIDAARQNTMELERDLAELTVEAVIDEVDTHLGAVQHQVEFLGEMIARGDVSLDDERRLTDLMIGALAAAPQVSGIALVRPDFSVLRAGRLDGRLVSMSGSWAEREDVRQAMQNAMLLQNTNWRTISWIDDFQAPHVIAAEPAVRDGQLLGLLFSVASVSALSGFLADFDAANQTRSFILYGRDRVLAHPALVGGFHGLSAEKPLPALSEVNDAALANIWDEVVDDMAYFLADSPISGHVVRGPGDDVIFLYREIDIYGDEPWLIGVYFLSSEVQLPLRRLMVAGGLGLVILMVALASGLLLARSLVRPLERLVEASEAVRRLELRGVQPLRASVFRELDVAVKAFDSMLGGLRWFETYVPKSLVLRLMRDGGSSVPSEEREVTVLFTDIVGFTRIGSRLAPSQLADLLNQHFTLLADAIETEEGTVDKYIGDSIMAFWGAPLDQPDHAARACRAAEGIADRVRADNARRQAAGQDPLALRIGIHSGPAVVGNIGAPGRINYTMIGDTVNLAQRLEGLGKKAAPEADVAVLMSAATRAALGVEFQVEGLGHFPVHGHDEPLEVYRLVLPAGRASSSASQTMR